MVLKQCGHVATTFRTLAAFIASMFACAWVWYRYSLPMRRAGSPLQVSLPPWSIASLLGGRIPDGLVEVLTRVDNDHLGVERLSGQKGRTLLLAPAAFGAGVQVEQVLPGPLGHGVHAIVFGMLEIDRGECRTGPRSQLAEEDIGNGDDDVQLLRARDIDQESQHRQDVNPVKSLVRRGGRRPLPASAFKEMGDARGDWPPGCRGIAAFRDPGRVLPEHPDHDDGDQAEDDEGVDFVALLELARPDDEPVHERHDDADQDQDAKQVLKEGDPGVPADQRQAEAGMDALAERLDDRGQQDDKSPEDEEVENARVEVAKHPSMEADVAENAADPLGHAIEPVLVRAEPQHAV